MLICVFWTYLKQFNFKEVDPRSAYFE